MGEVYARARQSGIAHRAGYPAARHLLMLGASRRRPTMRSILATALLACTLPAAAAVTVIQADRVLVEPGKAPRGATSIVVENGKVTALLPGRQSGPAGAKVIDLGNAFVLPGLIDSHVHLDSDAGGQMAFLENMTQSPGTAALRAQWNGM
jgi:adenine deaminase